MARRIQLRRDTAANWSATNPTLAQGEIGIDLTNNKIKIGTGSTAWNSLSYFDDKETVLSNYAGHIVPSADNTYDLGAPDKQWRDIYVSNGSVYIGDIKLSNEDGRLLVQQVTDAGLVTEEPVEGSTGVVTTDRLINGSAEVVLFADGPEPYTLFPATTNDDQLQISGSEISSASGDLALTSQGNAYVISNGAGVGGGSKNWTFGSDGTLTLPAGTTYEYFNTPLTGHGDGLARLDFTLSTDGVATSWMAASANPAGSGYSIGDTFTFDSTFLGITGASVTIEVLTIGPGGSVGNLGFTIPPLYPADIQRDSPINVQVGNDRWTFGNNGNLTLPDGGDIVDSNGDSVLGGGGSISVGTGTGPSVQNVTEILINGSVTEIEPGLVGISINTGDTSVSYKGFKATYGRMYDSEPTISKVLIYQDTVSSTPTSEVDTDTSSDLFQVSGLANSDVVALVNVYGDDTTHPTALSTLQHFVKSIVDNVILNGGQEGNVNTVEDMKINFYDLFDNFASRAGERYKNFKFTREEWLNISSTVQQGTGATFDILNNGSGGYVVLNVYDGTDYLTGHKVKILGTDLGGVTPDNDLIVEVTAALGVPVGGTAVSGTAPGTSVDQYIGVTGTNYNVGSGATFDLFRNRWDDTIENIDFNQRGVNYQVDDVVTVFGTALGGTSPANDIVITVTGVGVGGQIDNYSYTGTLPNNLFPLDNIEDGGSDQNDRANYIYTNIQGNSRADPDVDIGEWALDYNSGNPAAGDAWFGANSDYVVTYNDSIFGLFVTGANINWIATDGNSGFDGDGIADTGPLDMSNTDGLTNGDQIFTLNSNGSVTFPDGTVQTTAYTEGDGNVWVQTFETMTGAPADIVAIANSVEYLSNGDIVALFNNITDANYFGGNRYNSIARFTPAGEKVWSMSFTGALAIDGWGLAVSSDHIYVAGVAAGIGYNVAMLTKLDQSNGSIAWSKTYDVGYSNTNLVVDVGYDNNPVVVGYAYNGSDNQIVTTKIDSTNGSVIWSRALNGQNSEEAYGMAVGRNNNNEVVTVGWMDNLGIIDGVATLYADNNSNWTGGALGVTSNGVAFSVTVTAGVATFSNISDTIGNRSVDNVIATINGSVFGGVDGVDDMVVKVGTLAANDTDDRMLVVKYDSSGTIAWQKAIQVEAGYSCRGADADIDSNGNVYVCGNFDYAGPGGQNSAMIIIKFNFQGVKKWTRKVQGPCQDFASSIVVGPDDCLYLSAFTADTPAGPNTDYSMVVAKYNLDGTVAWQRVLDSISGSTFAGGFFFGTFGSGSTIAVQSGYVAVSGAFSNSFLDTSAVKAIVAQFDTDGKTFTVGDYDFKAATFSGLLNTTASNITVVNAGKTDSNYAGEFTVGDFEPTFNLASDLLGTVYRSINPGNELRNGNYFATLNANGSITLPAGGKISEAVVTSNPTIQLTPARPDVASQKLVIKGGSLYYFTDNGIELNYNDNTLLVGDLLTIYVNSSTYAGQTLYWWIYPEGVGVLDSDFGSLALNSNGNGQFTIQLDSDDYEFRVRVSPENNNYDPASIGVQSGLINSDAPAFDADHHLHLTTGNLSETSILLGTDNHNVRTTTDGGIQVTTQTTTVELPFTITITGADVAAVNLVYTRDLTEITPTWTSPEVNPATDPYIVWSEADGEFGIIAPDIDPVTPVYVNTGTLAVPLAQWSTNPPLGSIPPLGVYTYLTPDVHAWQFGIDGATTFPTLTVPISDNATPNGTGQVLKFSDSTQQAIIYGPTSTADNISAERIIIQGAPGYTGTAGEGGDVYLWAGPGGDTNGNGGDIKVRAGQGHGTGGGGYLNFQAGDSGTGNGGWINIESGQSNTYGNGGDITVQAHDGGEIFLRTHNSITTQTWTFDETGTTTLPGAVVNSTVAKTGIAYNIGTATALEDSTYIGSIVDGSYGPFTRGLVTFTVVVTSGVAAYTVTATTGNTAVGAVIGTLDTGDLGGTSGSTSNISVADVVQSSTAIDLTKSVNKLAGGFYTLANGTEGQIMYLVAQNNTVLSDVQVSVTNARISGSVQGGTLLPFRIYENSGDGFYEGTGMCTLIFTDGAWQQSGGAWD